MKLFFIDDAFQVNPSRPGMGSLLGIGGINVDEFAVKPLEQDIEDLCDKYKFPPSEPFKWSPGRELWMHDHLVEKNRESFYIELLGLASQYSCTSVIVIEDKKYNKAIQETENHEIDTTCLFLERAQHEFNRSDCNGIVIVSQPSGDRKDETKFLADCIDTVKKGTEYVDMGKIALVTCSPARCHRLLQLADIIVSCTNSFVSGESSYSPVIFNMIKPLLATESRRIGGVGLKIHPDIKYMNLYHWLAGDDTFWKSNCGFPLPQPNFPYRKDPYIF